MLLRIRLDVDDDEDEDGQADGDSDSDTGSLRGWFLNPPDPGGVFVRVAMVGITTTVLSVLGLVVQLLAAADEPFVDQPTLEEPILGWVWLLSLTATALSVFGYTAWSFRRQRQLERQHSVRGDPGLLGRPIGALRIAFADSEDLTEHERRVQKTVFALFVGGMLGYLPARILLDTLLSL